MKLRSLLILSAIALLVASCGNKGGKSGLLVPKDAAIVFHINSASLSSKISWEEIRQANWFKEMSKGETDTLARQLLADPASSGIDTKKDFVCYIKKQGRGGYMVFEGTLASPAAYEKVLVEMNKKEAMEIKKDGDFNYVTPDNTSLIIWNKSMFAIVANSPMPDMTSGFMGKGRSERDGFETDSLKIFGKEALTLKGSNNLDTDSRFAELVKNGSDMHMWLNAGKFFPGMDNPMLSMMKLNTLLEDNISAISLNFDNGKISAQLKHYYGDEMNRILSNNKPEPVSADVLNRIPSSNVVGVMAFNYSPQALKEILKMTGVDAMADMFLAKVDFSIDDFVKANKGEVLVAVSDLNEAAKKQDSIGVKDKGGIGMVSHMKTDMKVLFATSVKDKAAFEKMVTLVWDMSKQFRRNDSDSHKPAISYKLENNWFAVSNSAEYTDKFLAGGNNKLPFADKISGHPIGLYMDLQKIIQFGGSMAAKEDGNNASTTAAINASLNMWQDIVAKGGDYKDKTSEFEFEINLVDKNTNSLKQLNQYMDKMMDMKKEKMAAWKMKELKIDEIKEMPPPPPPKSKGNKTK